MYIQGRSRVVKTVARGTGKDQEGASSQGRLPFNEKKDMP
jgi:hypothetical protein